MKQDLNCPIISNEKFSKEVLSDMVKLLVLELLSEEVFCLFEYEVLYVLSILLLLLESSSLSWRIFEFKLPLDFILFSLLYFLISILFIIDKVLFGLKVDERELIVPSSGTKENCTLSSKFFFFFSFNEFVTL